MAGTKIGDLFMALSLNPELKSWDAGKAVIERTVSQVKALALESQMAKVNVRQLGEQMGLVARQSHWDKIRASGEGASSSIWGMVKAAVALVGVWKVAEMTKSTVDLGGKLNDTSQKTGLSTEALQKWGYALKLNSSDTDSFVKSTVFLAKGLDTLAQKGEGPAADGLKALGISLSDPAVKGKDLEKVLYLVVNAASKLPDGEKKMVAFRDLLGKTGVDLIPTFNNGIAGMAKYGAELEKLDAIIDKDSVSRLDDLGDNIDRTKVAFEGLKNKAVIALLPLLENLMNRFQEWIANNKELIRSTLQTVVEGLANAVSVLGSVVAFTVRHWKLFAALIGGAMLISGIVKLIRFIMFLEAAMSSAAIEAIIAWAAVLGPILAIGLAITALGLLIYEFRDEIWSVLSAIGGFFKDLGVSFARVMTGVWDSFTATLSELWDYLKKGFAAAWEFVADLPIVKQLVELASWYQSLLGSGGPSPEETARDNYDNTAVYDPVSGVLMTPGTASSGATGVTPDAGPPTAPARAGGSGPVTVSNSYTLQIDAKNADAHEVGQIVDGKLREHDERRRQDTAAALGVGGFR